MGLTHELKMILIVKKMALAPSLLRQKSAIVAEEGELSAASADCSSFLSFNLSLNPSFWFDSSSSSTVAAANSVSWAACYKKERRKKKKKEKSVNSGQCYNCS